MSKCGTAKGGNDGRTSARLRPAYAAIDLGTNNCRLLVARPEGSSFRVVDAFSRIVRLGEGLDANGTLSEAAIRRTLSALRVCASKIRGNGVVTTRSVATEACRKAANGQHFLARVQAETGLALEIISTHEEARLALTGCMALLEPAYSHALVFDIGGGSTELIWIDLTKSGEENILGTLSLPCGVVNLSERHGGKELTRDGYEEIVASVADLLRPFEQAHGIVPRLAGGSVQMLGTSGTVTTLAALHLGLSCYDRRRVDGCHLTFAELDAVMTRLAAMTYEERTRLPCVGRPRADLVLVGSAILDAICRLWPVGRLRVADRGLREGILLGLMQGHRCAAAAKAD